MGQRNLDIFNCFTYRPSGLQNNLPANKHGFISDFYIQNLRNHKKYIELFTYHFASSFETVKNSNNELYKMTFTDWNVL